MTQHTPLFIAFAVALSAVIGGALLFENDDAPQPESALLEEERSEAEGSRDPFIQEYQELEKLLEETRAQREMRAAKQRRAQLELKERSEAVMEEIPVAEVPTLEIPAEEPVLVESPRDPEPLATPPERVAVVEPTQAEPGKTAAEIIKVQPKTTVVSQPSKPQQIEPTAVEPLVSPQTQVATKAQLTKARPVKAQPQQTPPKEVLKKRVKKVEVKPKPAVKKVAKRAVRKQGTERSANARLSQKHVQVGAFTSKARANAIADDLQESHFNLEVVPVRQGGKRYYLLRDYSATTRKEALRLKNVYDEWLKVDSLVRY